MMASVGVDKHVNAVLCLNHTVAKSEQTGLDSLKVATEWHDEISTVLVYSLAPAVCSSFQRPVCYFTTPSCVRSKMPRVF